MDPLTQGALGAALPQATRNKTQVGIAGTLGFLAGMAADLDVLIRSEADPLMFLEYHRQFTHALIFIPVGGLICALALHWVLGRRWQLTFVQTFLFCTLGYATHPLLDSATSYGTMLFWPFSEERFALSIVSVVDPLFTLPVLVLVVLSGFRRKPALARIALAWAVLYLTAGALQHQAARAMAEEVAASRGHRPIRLEVKPSFANILVWKTIYETPDRFYVDAVRASFLPRMFPGVSVPKLDRNRDLPWLDPSLAAGPRHRTFPPLQRRLCGAGSGTPQSDHRCQVLLPTEYRESSLVDRAHARCAADGARTLPDPSRASPRGPGRSVADGFRRLGLVVVTIDMAFLERGRPQVLVGQAPWPSAACDWNHATPRFGSVRLDHDAEVPR